MITGNIPFPLIEMEVRPVSKKDRDRFISTMTAIVRADPDAFFSIHPEDQKLLLGGGDELQLDGILLKMRQRDIAVTVGAPQVAYRETITRKVTQDYTHKKQTGGAGQFARVILEVEPNEKAAGNLFESKIVGGSVPKEYIPGVEKGLNSVLTNGPLIGFPVVDLKVTLIDGAYHEVDSSAIAFEIATRAAMREAFEKAGPILLEPIMSVEVKMPGANVAAVIHDFHARRGKVIETSAQGEIISVTALVPLANMFGYINNLRSMSQGRASCTMSYSHYEPVDPPDEPGNFPPAIGMRL